MTSFTGIILDAGRMRAELLLTETGKLEDQVWEAGEDWEFSFKRSVEMSSGNIKVMEKPVQQKSGIWGRGPSQYIHLGDGI